MTTYKQLDENAPSPKRLFVAAVVGAVIVSILVVCVATYLVVPTLFQQQDDESNWPSSFCKSVPSSSSDDSANTTMEMIDPSTLLSYWESSIDPRSPDGTTISTTNIHHRLVCPPQIRRAIVVGDVHGCSDELRRLLHKTRYNAQSDIVVFVGDLMNRGPDSLGALRLARMVGGISVRGNHDDNVLRGCARRRLVQKQLETNKDDPKLAQSLHKLRKFAWTDSLSDEEVAYLNNLPYTLQLPPQFRVESTPHKHFTTPKDVLIVHAGLIPDVALANQMLKDMLTMRSLRKGKSNWESLVHGGKKSQSWAKLWAGPTFVYFGHDAKRGLQIHNNTVGLDSACVFGEKLTAAILPEGKLIDVEARKAYFSNKKN